MKTNRKTFIKKTALAGILMLGNNNLTHANILQPKVLKTDEPTNKPIVLSTWKFGIKANESAWLILNKGGRALDAVEAGINITEADPEERSVGYGGRPDRDGRITLDACIMDEIFNIGSVACLEHIMHPVSVARAVMEKTPHVMLVGVGALQFALSQGFVKQNLMVEKSEKEYKQWLLKTAYHPKVNIENHDTIGMIALDAAGNLSGACSTSGMAFKMHGRVGDSPIIGAGLYVDNEVGAATATGHGEEVIRVAGCHLVVEYMRMGKSPEEACIAAVERIVSIIKLRKKSMDEIQVGFIALNKKGEYGSFCVQQGFNYAVYDGNGNKLIDAKFYKK
ncbi:MAG: N(4)-(beta-N-acetylglucosaminyl)-L-asparaginase [Bacteroidia bacterium]|nr:N(4)-(beta-N-acetylglucosaminyl)-L-asparaginase [Bacteroidia bacterium]